jgi:hypothetical protein
VRKAAKNGLETPALENKPFSRRRRRALKAVPALAVWKTPMRKKTPGGAF